MNPYLECVIETNPDAVEIAQQLDDERKKGKVRGPLHGIPVLVKDVSRVLSSTLHLYQMDRKNFSWSPKDTSILDCDSPGDTADAECYRTWQRKTKCRLQVAHGHC